MERKALKRLSQTKISQKNFIGSSKETNKLSSFLKVYSQKTENRPLSFFLNKAAETSNLKRFNLQESPVASKVNVFNDEDKILNLLSQTGSTPEKISGNSESLFKGNRDKYSKTTLKTRSQNNSVGDVDTNTKRFEIFLGRYSEETRVKLVTKRPKLPSSSNSKKEWSAEASFSSFTESNHGENTVLENLKETKPNKLADKNNYTSDVIVVSDEKSFSSGTGSFSDSVEDCARTRKLPYFTEAKLKELTKRNSTKNMASNKNVKPKEGENLYNSPLFKGLDFIEEFMREYQEKKSKNNISESRTRRKSFCSSDSERKRKYRPRRLDNWFKNIKTEKNTDISSETRNVSTTNKLKRQLWHRKSSSEVSFKTKGRSSQIINRKPKNSKIMKLFHLDSHGKTSPIRKGKSNDKNLMTNYFSKRKFIDAKKKDARERSTDNCKFDRNCISSCKGKEDQFKKKDEASIGTYEKKHIFNRRELDKYETGNDSVKTKSQVEKKTQKNLYSSEGFCESMSLTPKPNSSNTYRTYLNRDTTNILHRNSLSVKRNATADADSCSTEVKQISQKSPRRKLTSSEERDLSPDFYTMKMCGPEGLAIVEKILSGYKNDKESQGKTTGHLLNSQNNLNQNNNSVPESLSDPLSFGNPTIIYSGNVILSQQRDMSLSTVHPKFNIQNSNIDSYPTKGIYRGSSIKSKNNNSSQCNFTKHLQKANSKIFAPTFSPNQHRAGQIINSPSKIEKLDSQALKDLHKLHKSSSWNTQAFTRTTENIITNLFSQKTEDIINPTKNVRNSQDSLSKHLLVVKETTNQIQKVRKPKLLTPTSSAVQNSPVNFQQNSKLTSFFTPPDRYREPRVSGQKTKTLILKTDVPNPENMKNVVDNSGKEFKSQNIVCDDPILHLALTQNFEDIFNDDYNYENKSFENLVNKETTKPEDVCHTKQNCVQQESGECHTQKNNEESELFTQTENVCDSQMDTQNVSKNAKKTYNITKDCILYEDNLLKSLLEDKYNSWRPSLYKNPVKRKNNEEFLIQGPQSYIKRYKKGGMKIFKIKPRIRNKNEENYRPPEGQILEKFLKKVDNDFQDQSSTSSESADNKDFVSTPISYLTDETKSEVLSTGSSKLTVAQKILRQAINKLSKDKSLLFSKFEDTVPKVFNRNEIIENIELIVDGVLKDFEENNNPCFRIPKENISNCIFKDGRYQMKEQLEYSTVSYKSIKSRPKFNLILFLLSKLKNQLQSGTKLTKREIYYQLKTMINSQGITDRALKDISRMLNVGLWTLNVTAQKGLVYGNLKLVMSDGETMNCNVPGTSIPHDISKICEIHSKAYFILVVEKESIFHKLLEENLPNRLTRPFILITGKGFPDLNTQLFLKKLWMVMSIPVFILADADPDGIAIMLNYRFGSIANAHVSEHLAIPKARWLGVFPSEILRLSFSYENLGKREISMTHKLLQSECVQQNEKIKKQLEQLLENRIKTGIEGLVKTDTFLSNCYLSRKFYTEDLI